MKLKMEKIKGLVAAPFAPMTPAGELDLDRIPAYHEFLVRNRISGAFINGSTGEGVSLTVKEKMRMTEAWAMCNRENRALKLISLVGGTCWKECSELAAHARESGIDAVAVIAPYYFKPSRVEPLAEFVALVGQSVPEMPVYFYHIPVLTGVSLPMIGFLGAISGMLPNFAGIKYTHEDFMDYQSCLNFNEGRYDMLWGRDENMLAALALGARGAVGSTYNYAAPLYHQLIAAFDSGNLPLARQLQQKSIDMIRLLGKYGGIATGKAFMRYIGFDCGKFRLPVTNMSEEQYAGFTAEVEQLGLEHSK